MRKILLSLMICTLMFTAACKKSDEPALPKSIKIYHQLNLTDEQNERIAIIKAAQKGKIDVIRKDIEKKKNELLDLDGKKKFSKEKAQENVEKYRTAVMEMQEKVAAERAAYDASVLDVLNPKQQKTYVKYMKQREKEKIQREKDYIKMVKGS